MRKIPTASYDIRRRHGLADLALRARRADIEIPDGSIGAGKLGPGCVGPVNIQDGAVEAPHLSNGCVGESAIVDWAVTADKIRAMVGGSNLVYNSTFDIYTNAASAPDGWSALGSGVTCARTTGRGGTGYATRCTLAAGAGNISAGITTDTCGAAWIANRTYVISWWARAVSGAAIGKTAICFWDVEPETETSISNPDLTTDWQRYAFRVKWGASTETSKHLNIYAMISAPITGSVVDIDDVQVVEGELVSEWQVAGGAAELVHLTAAGKIDDLGNVEDGATWKKVTNVSAANQVVEASIAALAVTSGKLAANAVIAGKLADGAVDTSGRLAAEVVTAPKVADTAVGYRQLNISGSPLGGAIFNLHAQIYTRG